MAEQETGSSPLAEALARVGDRWTLLVVEALLGGPQRFNDLLMVADDLPRRAGPACPWRSPGRPLRVGPGNQQPFPLPVTDPGRRLGKRGRAVLLFSHERIPAASVDSRAVVSSNLQVTSYWRHSSDDNP